MDFFKSTEHRDLTLRECAEAFRLLLRMELADVADVVIWADEQVLALPEPPLWLIDVALAPNESHAQMERRLADDEGPGSLSVAAFAARDELAKAWRSGRLNTMRAATALYLWADTARVTEREQYRARIPYWVADLVADGVYGSMNDVERELGAALAR